MNMRSIEKVGRTVDDAITEALIELGASTDEVNIEIISKGSKGLLGFGAKEAKVRVTLKENETKEEIEVEEIKEIIPDKVSIEVEEELEDSDESVVTSKEEIQNIIGNAERFLEKLLKQMNIECKINSEIINNSRVSISLEGKKYGYNYW